MRRAIVFSGLLLVVVLIGAGCQIGKADIKQSSTPTQTEAVGQPSGMAQPVDTDGDGLSDEQEQSLKTDPAKADTDGDGYSDGVEVASGYSPLEASARSMTDVQLAATCADKASFIDRASCFFEKYRQKVSGSSCDLLTNKYQRLDCFIGVAMAQLDPQLCDKLSTEEERELCYSPLATALNDPGLCNHITDDPLRADVIADCKDDVASDRKEFDEECLSGSDEYCYPRDQWLHTGLCRRLASEVAQQRCFIAYAATLHTGAFCELLPLCAKQSGPCLDIPTIGGYGRNGSRDTCYFEVGRRAWSAEACDKISQESEISEKQDECYSEVAARAFDLGICSSKLRNSKECRLGVAAHATELSQCNTFTAQDEKERCWERVAFVIPDVSLCHRITGEPERSNCFFGLAVRMKNVALCDEVRDVRDNCIQSVRGL